MATSNDGRFVVGLNDGHHVLVRRDRNVRGELDGKVEVEVQGYGLASVRLSIGQAREVAAALMAFVRAAEGGA